MSELVSVVVLTHNSEGVLVPCLTSVFEQDYSSFDVIVVDNNSVDLTRSIIFNHPRAKPIFLKENNGFSAGMNAGIKAGKSDLILCLNPDTELPTNFLSEMVKRATKGVAVVGAVQNYKRNKILLAGSGASILIRKSLLGSEPFDSDYFLYAEEEFIHLKAWSQGFQTVVQQEAIFKHDVGHSTKRVSSSLKKFLAERNRLLNRLRFFPVSFLAGKGFFQRELINLFSGVFTGFFFARLKAIYWILTNWRVVKEKRLEGEIPLENLFALLKKEFG